MVRVVSGTKLDGIVIVANWTDRDDLVSDLEVRSSRNSNCLTGTRLILVRADPRFREAPGAAVATKRGGDFPHPARPTFKLA